MKKISLFVVLLLIMPLKLLATDFTYDLGIYPSDISFSKQLIAGQVNRIYARIHNEGQIDVSGYVTFYQGDILIGDSQVVSVRAGGLADEVYVDWQVPTGSFNIRAEIKGQNPKDENPVNDITLTSLFVPLPDTDGDGTPDPDDQDDDGDNLDDDDENIWGTDPLDNDSDDDGCLDGEDNFPLDPDLCSDNDGDGIDNKIDNDDDNDGLPDDEEDEAGTNPFDHDTDNDGTPDGDDDYPLDPNRDKVYTAPKPEEDESITNEETLDENVEENNENSEDLSADSEESQSEIELKNGVNFKTSALIKVMKDDWNTYTFSPEIRGVITSSLAYQWDFGDGTQSNQNTIQHTFSQPGSYQVTLKIMGKDNMKIETAKLINISFFNLENPYVIGLVFILFILLLLLFIYILSKKEKVKHKKKK